MVKHDVRVQGVSLSGTTQDSPALLQMNNEDFPARFFTDLAAMSMTPGSSITTMTTSPGTVTLYQPVQRIVHLALLQLTCESSGTPRLDPTRIDSAGLVIRRVIRNSGVDDPSAPPSAWMKSADGQFQWVALNKQQERQDPDPTKRPLLQSGQAALDNLLAQQVLATAQTEIYTPAFPAPPAASDVAGRTFVYGVIPTASSEVTTNSPSPPQYDPAVLTSSLPTLLQAGSHSAPYADQVVNYQFMSDDYARAQGGASFLTFSTALRMMYSVFGAFQNTPQAKALITELNNFNVYQLQTTNNVQILIPTPMGVFYQNAATALIDDPSDGNTSLTVTMPHAWDSFQPPDASTILGLITNLLQTRSAQVLAPLGRFQDATRLYRLRIFVRIKGHTPSCPTELVWSRYSDPFRIAAWHESGGRTQAPVPLPDPTDPAFRKSATPNCSFAVPAALMNAMNGTTLSGLSSGAGSSGGGVQLDWICGFNIPLITICAFFVLNIFLTLLNLVFFWLPIIKICIPFPMPTPANSGDSDGT
jgi:hypothetical protein